MGFPAFCIRLGCLLRLSLDRRTLRSLMMIRRLLEIAILSNYTQFISYFLKLLNCYVGLLANVKEAELIALFPLNKINITFEHILFHIVKVEVYQVIIRLMLSRLHLQLLIPKNNLIYTGASSDIQVF